MQKPATDPKPFRVDLPLVSICFINILSNGGYALIAPFLPIELKNKGVDEAVMGYIFSVYSVTVIFGSPLIGLSIKRHQKRRLMMQVGLGTMTLSMLGYCAASIVEDRTLMFVSIMATRVLQGFSSCAIRVTSFAIIG